MFEYSPSVSAACAFKLEYYRIGLACITDVLCPISFALPLPLPCDVAFPFPFPFDLGCIFAFPFPFALVKGGGGGDAERECDGPAIGPVISVGGRSVEDSVGGEKGGEDRLEEPGIGDIRCGAGGARGRPGGAIIGTIGGAIIGTIGGAIIGTIGGAIIGAAGGPVGGTAGSIIGAVGTSGGAMGAAVPGTIGDGGATGRVGVDANSSLCRGTFATFSPMNNSFSPYTI